MEGLNSSVKNISKGVGIALIATVILLLIFSLLLTYTNLSENTISPVIIVITAISVLLGSSIGNRKIKKNGILNGAFVGGCYIILLYLISSILNWRFSLNLQSVIMMISGMIFGVLGGIIGVNI